MGRDCGYTALMAGIAGGAEAIAIPEVETNHIARGQHGLLIGMMKGEIATTPLTEVVANKKRLKAIQFSYIEA